MKMSTKSFIFLTFSCFILISISNAYRILVIYPTPTISHQKGQQIITQKLAENDHEIVVVSPIAPLEAHPNIKHINISELWQVKKNLEEMSAKNLSSLGMYVGWKDVTCQMIEIIMEHDVIHKLMMVNAEQQGKQHFDGIIVELLGMTTLHAFKEYFNASTLIGLSSVEPMLMVHKELGNPTHPLLAPDVILKQTKYPHFFKRVQLAMWYLCSIIVQYLDLSKSYDKLTRKYFNSHKTSAELLQEVDFSIIQVSPILMNIRPLLPNTLQIGFMHIKPPQPLPSDLQEFMDEATRGIIYVSLGATLRGTNIGYDMINLFKETFSTLNYTIIWKFESNSLKAKPANIKLMNWVPQSDLLAHPNVCLFITQGGLQSMEEFIARGIPAIAIPYFADQMYNARVIDALGVGKYILKEDITKEKLLKTIHEVIGNETYKNRAKELYNVAMDRPMAPVDEAVWWIEYAIRHKGAKFLKYPGKDMPWYQWLLLDVILFYLVLFVSVPWVLVKIVKCCRKEKTRKIK